MNKCVVLLAGVWAKGIRARTGLNKRGGPSQGVNKCGVVVAIFIEAYSSPEASL